MNTIPLISVDEIDSTSDELKRRAEAGSQECALLARRQTAGRGRLGRSWTTIEGNLFLSILLRPSPPIQPGQWSLMAAVVLAETLLNLDKTAAIAPRLSLKWPNDLMLDGAKLAGILLETGGHPAPFLVIGFGANLAAAPAQIGRPTTSLGGGIDPLHVANAVLETLATWRQRYAGQGFAPVRAAWLERGPQIGNPISVSGHPAGRFRTIGPDGSLVVDTESGPITIVSGEVA